MLHEVIFKKSMTRKEILRWGYDKLIEKGEDADSEEMAKFKAMIDEYIGILERPIESLDLSVRSMNILRTFNAVTIGDILELNPEEMMRTWNCGKSTIRNIKTELMFNGVNWV